MENAQIERHLTLLQECEEDKSSHPPGDNAKGIEAA